VFDIVILTEPRYLNPEKTNPYIRNVLLEDHLMAEALRKNDLTVTRKSWDDPNFDWSTTKYALFRTTWDCFDRFEEFHKWFKNTKGQTQFINSYRLISWNMDKHYLKDLQLNGVNIPKTLYTEPNVQINLLETIQKAKSELGFIADDFVLKPCIAAAARHTYKFHISEWKKHRDVFQKLISKETMMLQEFQKNIVSLGEVSMVLCNGKFAHAVLKIAKPGDFRVQDDHGGTVHKYNPSQEEIGFAENVALAVSELPVYARVDIFRDNENNLALAELEIFEPELWFRLFPETADMLAKTIKHRLFNEAVKD